MSAGGRPEKPVDQTVPARAKLAAFLRARKAEAGMTYQQMADDEDGLSKATFERAASGAIVPSWDTVEAFVRITAPSSDGLGTALSHSRGLLIRARRATRAPYYLHKAPDPTLIASKALLLQALRDQHVWAGCPTPGEMERMAGFGRLPQATVRRIINGRSLPVTPDQAIAFLKACEVAEDADLERWLRAGSEALLYEDTLKAYAWWKAAEGLKVKDTEATKLKLVA
ncbi:helix-turn-helix transcriptional regulator [Streptomyces sp. NPDC052000]|uniref:helix-turn-helix domain-containing protein n=1 Tax=Streptomyces sp. NPDC052000 TaxID=3155676 RepID=UPI0034500D49